MSGAESSRRVEACLGKVRRWTRLGEPSSGCQHFLADDTGSAVVERDGAGGAFAASSSSARQHGRARGACNVAVLKRDDFVCGTLHAGFAGRHGEERAPVGRRAARPRPGVLRQARLRECDNRETLSSLSDLTSSFVPHARFVFPSSSLVSENSCRVHAVGAMNSCGSMHGAVMHDNSLGMHVNSRGAMDVKT